MTVIATLHISCPIANGMRYATVALNYCSLDISQAAPSSPLNRLDRCLRLHLQPSLLLLCFPRRRPPPLPRAPSASSSTSTILFRSTINSPTSLATACSPTSLCARFPHRHSYACKSALGAYPWPWHRRAERGPGNLVRQGVEGRCQCAWNGESIGHWRGSCHCL